MPEQQKRKISIALKGINKPTRSIEHCRKLSEARKGTTSSRETCKRMSESMKKTLELKRLKNQQLQQS